MVRVLTQTTDTQVLFVVFLSDKDPKDVIYNVHSFRKVLVNQKQLWMPFVDLENAFDCVH